MSFVCRLYATCMPLRHTIFCAKIACMSQNIPKTRIITRLPINLVHRIDALNCVNGRSSFIRQAIVDALEKAEAGAVKAGKPGASEQPSTQRPWHEACGWQFMRDVIVEHLESIGEHQYLHDLSRGYDTPDDYWQEFYSNRGYVAMLDMIEGRAIQRDPSLFGH